MPRVLRFICLGILLLLLQANGCDDENPRGNKPRPSPSSTASSTATDATTSPSPSPTLTPTATTTRMTGLAIRTGVTITRDNKPIDAAGLAALGWTKVDAAAGQANWSDPALGTISVTWDLPDERAVCCFDLSYWGEVTGNNLAMGPVSMGGTVFTFAGSETDTGAHSIGGVKAEAPTRMLSVSVPEVLTGTTATVSINLGFPQPVLVAYNYVFQ